MVESQREMNGKLSIESAENIEAMYPEIVNNRQLAEKSQ
jgi:hypothetical protein